MTVKFTWRKVQRKAHRALWAVGWVARVLALATPWDNPKVHFVLDCFRPAKYLFLDEAEFA